ncbi:MAG: FIST C-terminal domain-containing protein [Burkholderiales bacterium]|nr:FIST C-terminal domain-containing protein [Burkholderiales bacterium]
MKILQETTHRTPTAGELAPLAAIEPHLVLAFGAVERMTEPGLLGVLQAAFPKAVLAGCSTAGEIGNLGVTDGMLGLTAVHFEQPGVVLATTDLSSMADSFDAGVRLAGGLAVDGLHNVLVFGLGVEINGSALIAGLASRLPPGVAIAGGLAGDGGAFSRTWTLSSRDVSDRQLVAVGLHAPRTRVSHGSFHGWQPFGPARRVTRAEGNVLFELDGAPALDVYRRYLGEYAEGLPGTGLLFPFEMMGTDRQGQGLIRTILGIDRAAGSLILAGDIFTDGYLKLMHASTDTLIDGAQAAAERAWAGTDSTGDCLALLVSCVGRKLVMGARVDEEVEAVAAVFGRSARVAGFYSNGEISPLFDSTECRLHNQTMTITSLRESA